MSGEAPELSLVIPVYNGAPFISTTLQRAAAELARTGLRFEIVVVDDGSTDGTAAVVESAAATVPGLMLLRNETNLGKGGAVRRGLLAGRGRWRLFTDADLAYPAENLAVVVGALREGAPIVVANRADPSSRTGVESGGRAGQLGRRALGLTFRALTGALGLSAGEDTQAGLKGFSAEAAERLCAAQRISGYAFDVELLHLARLAELPVRRVPVTFLHQRGRSLGGLVSGSLSMARDLLRIRWFAWTGRYRSLEARPGASSRGLVLALLLLGLLAARGALLLFAFDDLFVPGYELWPVGSIANEVLHGLPSLPLLAFHDTHSGGQLLSGLLGGAVFALAGASFLALKLVPLLFSLGTLAAVFLVLDRRLGRASAVLAGLLLIAGPASFVDLSVGCWGNHGEVLFFVALTLGPFLDVVGDGRGGAWKRAVFGLTCGLAIWYALSALLVVALYLLFWLGRDRLFFVRRANLAWLGGLLAGLLPLLPAMLAHGTRELDWLAAKFVEHNQPLAEGPLARWTAFWTQHVPASPASYDLGPLSGRALDLLLVATWLVALLVLLAGAWPSLGRWWAGLRHGATELRAGDARLLLLAYPLLLAAAYTFSDFVIGGWTQHLYGGFRYLMTLFLLLAVAVAVAFHDLRARGQRAAAAALALAAVGLGLLGNAGHDFSSGALGDGLRFQGFNDFKLARIVASPPYDGDPAQAAALLAGLPPARRAEVYRGLGALAALDALRRDGRRGTHDFDPGAILALWPVQARTFVARGVGTQLAEHAQIEGQAEAAAGGLQALLVFRDPLAGAVVQGMFLPSEPGLPELSAARVQAALDAITQLPAALQPFALEGLGMHVGEALWRGVPRDLVVARAVIRQIATGPGGAAASARFHAGLGHACLDFWEQPEARAAQIEDFVAERDRPAVYEGLGWMSAELLGVSAAEAPPPAHAAPACEAAFTAGLRRGLLSLGESRG